MSEAELDSYGRMLEQSGHGVVAIDCQGRVGWHNPMLAELMGLEQLRGSNLWDRLGVPAQVAELEYSTPQGRGRHFTLRPLGCSGPWSWLGLQDTTCQERTNRRHKALLEVASSLTYRGTMEGTLDDVAAAVVRASRAQACSLWLMEGQELRKVGQAGLPENYHRAIMTLFRAGYRTPAAEAFKAGQRTVFRGAERIPAILANPDLAEAHDYFRAATWSMVFCVPLLFHGRPLGVLNCFYTQDPEDQHAEGDFLQAVADQAAVAVENARLICQLKGKAVLEERQRIARELHDSVNQALYGISLGANAALVQFEAGNQEAARQALHYLVGLSQAAMVEMRSLICELRPEALESEGLEGLLGRQLNSLQARHGLSVESTLLEPPLSLEAKHALYRVLQEGISNVLRHSQAGRVELRMEVLEGQLQVTLGDDGVGFQALDEFPGHYGLKNMGERMQHYGGRLQVVSAPGQGTRLTVELPLA